MKRFIFTVLGVAVFFVGLGALVGNVGAKFKSDEKALDLVKKARVAIGGDSAINGVQSLRIVGQTTRTIKIDGSENTARSETEIALQFPDKFMKMTKVGKDDGTGTVEKMINKQVDVVVVGDAKERRAVTVNGEARTDGTPVTHHKIIIKKGDGTVQELTGEEAKAWIASHPEVAGAAHTVMLRKSADGSVEHVGGATGEKVVVRSLDGKNETHTITLKKNPDGTVEQIGGPAGAKIILDKVDGSATGTWTTKDGNVVKKVDGDKVFVHKVEGGPTTWTSKDGKTIQTDKNVVFERSGGGEMRMIHDGPMKQNDFLRTTLALLLTAPQGMDVSYSYKGEGDVDGTACNIINAEFGGSVYKLYLNKSSNLPVMLSYSGVREPQVFAFRSKAPEGTPETKDVMTFNRKIEAAGAGVAEFNVKFTDYRSVNGVQLPYKWTQTVGGAADETFDVTSYEVNPANIAEKFSNEKVMVRTVKPDNK